jgi:predicted transglutaminase-like cysteine proteinase
MRNIWTWIAAIIMALMAVTPQKASANMMGMTRALGTALHHIAFRTPTLAPMAFTQFCLRYEDQCKPRRMVFRGGPVRLTAARLEQLREVNQDVNADITPERNEEGLAGEKWLIAPARGDCNDYAVTKRSELLARGWPVRSLLLSEVVTNSGEHHLILVVRTHSGDLVLDNLTSTIRPWSTAPYRWVRIQTPQNPNYWATIAGRLAA